MGDSTAMTIEFLRARLLSERTVSKAAKERADQLSERVVELEEKLRIMTFQRGKAELAATEAISILETRGMNDLSAAVDSGSDEDETRYDKKRHEENLKEDEVCTNARERVVVEDAQSSSYSEVSPSQVGSLLWKSRSSSPNSSRKLTSNQFRQRQRQYSFVSSIESSPKYKLGKSCRRVKRREMRLTSEENDFVIISDTSPKFYVNAMGSESSFAIVQKQETDASGSDRDEEMERVLEQQSHRIVRYETEEEAQRQWEMIYNASKNSNTPYRLNEVSGESLIDAFACIEKTPSEDVEVNSDIRDLSGIKEPNYLFDEPVLTTSDSSFLGTTDGGRETNVIEFVKAFVPTDLPRTGSGSISQACVDGSLGQAVQHAVVRDIEPCSVELSLPAKLSTVLSSLGKKNEGLAHESSDSGSSNNITISILAHGHFNSPSIGSHSTSSSRGQILKWELSGTQDPSNMKPCQFTRYNLGGVLDALQHVKLSLKQELSWLSVPGQCTMTLPTANTHNCRTILPGQRLKVPIGSAGLFRLPTDTFPRAQNSESKFYGSGLRSAAGHRSGCAITFRDNLQSAIPCSEAAPKNFTGKFNSSTYLPGIGVPASDRYSLPCSYLKAGFAPFANGTGVRLGTQNVSSYSHGAGIPPVSGYSLPAYLKSDETCLPSRSRSSVHKQYFDSLHGIEEAPTSRYSLPCSD